MVSTSCSLYKVSTRSSIQLEGSRQCNVARLPAAAEIEALCSLEGLEYLENRPSPWDHNCCETAP